MDGELLAQVCDLIRTEIGGSAPIGADTDLVADLELDSLALLQLTVELENRFRVFLEPDDDRPLTRVSDVVRLIERERTRAA